MWLAHLEEGAADDEEGAESEDPDGLDGMTEEFMVHLARAVKDAQQEEKHCYHCSSLDHFIQRLSIGEISQKGTKFKQQTGDGTKEGSLDPSRKGNSAKGTPGFDA